MAMHFPGSGIASCLCSLLFLLLTGCDGYLRVCYYTNWSQYRAPSARFLPENVDPFLCTHIVFAFAGVEDSGLRSTEYNDEEMYRRLTALKKVNPKLRVLLSVGGWLAGGARFSQLVSSEGSMQRFVDNATQHLRQHGLDGLDVDWEFPASAEQGSPPQDRVLFTRLLQLLREGFDQEAARGEKDRLLLTAAVVGDMVSARQSYQIAQIARSVDYIHLMAYDFYGQWDLSQGARHHSALNPDVMKAVQGWLQEGTPRKKLVLGVPAFARTFLMTTGPQGSGVGQTVADLHPAQLPARARVFTDNGGLLTYQQICELLTSGTGWQRVWLEDQQAPVAFGNISTELWAWGGYDDVRSITAKAKYVKREGLAGAMLWSMTNDDFNDRCRQGPWPLLTTLTQLLPDHAEPPEVSPTHATPAHTTPKTLANPDVAAPTDLPWPPRGTMTTLFSNRNGVPLAPPSVGPGSTATPKSSAGAAGYRQCRISDNFGRSLRCPGHGGKSGSRTEFYLFCFDGFFAIQCTCLPGFFYSRCRHACDADANFASCPFLY